MLMRISGRMLAGISMVAALTGTDEAATVTVIHGIPGGDLGLAKELPVDVEVAGVGCALTDFRFGDVSARLSLPAGAYDLRVRLSDGACGGAVAVEALGVPFTADENATVVAHLDPGGAPTASKFVNDLTQSADHQGRLQLHHTAAAGAVDIRLRRGFFFRKLGGVTNGQQGALDVNAGRYRVRVSAAGRRRPLLFDRVRVPAGKTVSAYAVGTPGTRSFTLLADVQDQIDPATVTVIHGITGQDLGLAPALPVDVEVVGVGCVLTDFTFGTISPRLALPAGSYDINVRLATGDCTGAVAVAVAGVPFAEGEDATVIAHLDASGGATASKFTNDVSRLRRREARFVAHHTAAAPAVDLALLDLFRRGRASLSLSGVTNGQSGGDDLRRGLYLFTIAPAGGHPLSIQFAPLFGGKARFVYVVGSLSGGTLQTIEDVRRF